MTRVHARQALQVLRSLCRAGAHSWRVSDVLGRVTLLEVWRDACQQQLALDPVEFAAAVDHLERTGRIVRDGPTHRRVYPSWSAAMTKPKAAAGQTT